MRIRGKESAAAFTRDGLQGLRKELPSLPFGEEVLLDSCLPEKARQEIKDCCRAVTFGR